MGFPGSRKSRAGNLRNGIGDGQAVGIEGIGVSGVLPARSLAAFPKIRMRSCQFPFPELRVGTGLTPAHHRLQPSSGAGCFPGEATGSRTRPLPDDRFRIGSAGIAGMRGEGAGGPAIEIAEEFLYRAT